jgi:hypothetical protein
MFRNSVSFNRSLILSLCFASTLFSQNGNGGGGGTVVQNFESNTALEVLRQIYNPDDLAAEIGEGRFTWRGNTFDIGNNRLVRSRFSRFLNAPAQARQHEEYVLLMQTISQRLSTANQGNVNPAEPWRNVIDAWEMLFEAASHPMDGGASEVIANTVFNYWRQRSEFNSSNFWNAVNRAEQRRMENRALATSHHERLARQQQLEQEMTRGRPSLDAPEIDLGLSANTPSGQYARDSMEMRALIEAESLSAAAIGLQAQLAMQSSMVSFLAERRFQHALITAQFYRHLFRGTAQDLRVGRDTLAQIIPDADFLPTVDILESVARQATEDVRRSVESILQSMEEGQHLNALERLTEAFLLGEHTPEIAGFPVEHRRTLRTLEQRLREVQRLAEFRDFSAVLNVAETIATEAQDFPMSEVAASVRAAMSASNLALFAARAALLERDRETARQEMALATEIWPLNPALGELMEVTSTRSDAASQAALLFDDAVSRSEYRRVYDRRGELMAALIEDPDRLRRLQSIVEDIARIDMLITQAEELIAQSNPHGAWEVLLLAGPAGEDDPVMNRAKARLAPAVARFIGLLDNARISEERGEYAVALIFFLQARELYPASSQVRRGLERAGQAALAQTRPPVAGL